MPTQGCISPWTVSEQEHSSAPALSEARQKQLMKWSQFPKRRPVGGIPNNSSSEVWKTNDLGFGRMGVSSYSSLMRLQLRGSRGIDSSRRGKPAGTGAPQGLLLKKLSVNSYSGELKRTRGWFSAYFHNLERTRERITNANVIQCGSI
ncbi:uncharacterized protein LOC118021128 isoform X2 [Mirounga leonina]|uniref:uncharacterized protein LOC118021128 isoform X2 n=1 Tax=Mirounga leonina TaxID=9715 RepID=UPI00156C4D99|nr:uncharacterized protein LOC118021128 isoform X2 [Mirounga leonina]